MNTDSSLLSILAPKALLSYLICDTVGQIYAIDGGAKIRNV